MSLFVCSAPGSEKRKSWTLKTLSRRAAAYLQLQDIDNAIKDFGSAVGIDPTNEALKSDLNKLNIMKSAGAAAALAGGGAGINTKELPIVTKQ